MVNRLDIQATTKQTELIRDHIIEFCGRQSIICVQVRVSDKERVIELKNELERLAK